MGESDAKSIQRMQRCAQAGTRERHGSSEEGTGEASKCECACQGRARTYSEAIRCTPDRVSTRLRFTDGRSLV
jgi:hypothetical protein